MSVHGLRIGLPMLLLVAAGVFVTWRFIEPAPPTRVVIAAGLPGGAYDGFAKQYAKYFKDNGFELVVKPTAGSIENYRLLADENSGVNVAIVQGGTAPAPEQQDNLQAICSIGYEPLWVFYRGETTIGRISQFTGMKLAIGKHDSGMRALALRVLSENGITEANPAGCTLVEIGGQEAADALKAGQVDAAFLVTAPESAQVQDLLRAPGIRLMSFDQADAYTRRLGFVSRVSLFRGVVDLGKSIPSANVTLIAPAAMLVTRKNAHHGTVELLVQAAKSVHSGGTLLSAPGEFPSDQLTDLPIGSDARYYLKSNPPRLLAALPFWLKSLLDRVLLLLIPLLALALPLIRIAPALLRWSVRSRIVRYYTRLRKVEEHLSTTSPRFVLEADQTNTDALATKLATLSVPAGYMPDLYDLRLHVDRLRDRLRSRLQQMESPTGN